MKKISEDQLKILFEAGYERRSLDFKTSFSWDNAESKWIRESVIRAVLGLTNTRGGGQVVIGVAEKDDKSLDFKGLDDKELASFNNFDSIKAIIDSFSGEPTDFEIAYGVYLGQKYIVITVSEFAEWPTICRKNGKTSELKQDEFYVRSKKGQPSTMKVTQLELREIIQMAADKEKINLETRGLVRNQKGDPQNYYRGKLGDLE